MTGGVKPKPKNKKHTQVKENKGKTDKKKKKTNRGKTDSKAHIGKDKRKKSKKTNKKLTKTKQSDKNKGKTKLGSLIIVKKPDVCRMIVCILLKILEHYVQNVYDGCYVIVTVRSACKEPSWSVWLITIIVTYFDEL